MTDASSPDAEVALAADVPFQAGVVGTDKQLTMFLSRVPQSLTDRQAAANPELLLPTDLRRVTYYLGSGGGLCRQDRPWVLAEGVRNSTDPDFTTEATDLIAPEVVDATFEYFDGSTWLSDWDGSYANTDGKSVTGPPRAIRVILILEFPETGDVVTRKTVQHTIAVRTANGLVPPAALPTDDTMTTTDPAAAATGTNGTTTTGGM